MLLLRLNFSLFSMIWKLTFLLFSFLCSMMLNAEIKLVSSCYDVNLTFLFFCLICSMMLNAEIKLFYDVVADIKLLSSLCDVNLTFLLFCLLCSMMLLLRLNCSLFFMIWKLTFLLFSFLCSMMLNVEIKLVPMMLNAKKEE